MESIFCENVASKGGNKNIGYHLRINSNSRMIITKPTNRLRASYKRPALSNSAPTNFTETLRLVKWYATSKIKVNYSSELLAKNLKAALLPTPL